MKLKELREQRAKLLKDARTILEKADQEKRELTSEEDEQFGRMHKDASDVRAKIVRLERQAKAELDERESRERRKTGKGLTSAVEREGRDGRMPREEARALALQGWCRRQSGLAPKKRHVEAAQQCGVSLSARHFDVRLSNDYPRVRNEARQFLRHESRGLSGDAASSGGVLRPKTFVSSLEAAKLQYGGMYQVAEVIRTSHGNEMAWPTANDTGNIGRQLGEAKASNEVDPSFGAVLWHAYKFTSELVKVPQELMEDTPFDLPFQLGMMLGERLGRIVNRKTTTGNGNATCKGLITAAAVGKQTASAVAIATDELLDLVHSVDPAHRVGAGFMLHDAIVLALRKLKDLEGRYIWQDDLTGGQNDRLLTFPVTVNQDMDSTIAAGKKTIAFGQLSKYKIREVNTVRLRRLVERFADEDQEGFVAFMRVDGNLLDAGSNPVKVLRQAP